MLIVTLILGFILSLLFLEKWIIQRSVDSLQLRIHVNGTRGKSSVTEYIGAGILNAQYDVIAKITGIIPTYFFNGKEQIITRTGAVRVQEQFSMIRLASKKKVSCLVLECMSVSPELQRMESSVFQPHIYVITNIRDDHREEMGRSIDEQAIQICSAIPENCTVITNETRYLSMIKAKAAAKNSKVISAQEREVEPVADQRYGVFPENISLALAVCEAVGIDRKLASEGIEKLMAQYKTPLTTVKYEAKEIRFLNAFAVNDVESTDSFLNHWKEKLGYDGKISLIFNSRADRPLRTELFADWIAGLTLSVEHIFITGNHSKRAKSSILKAGIEKGNIHVWKEKDIKNIKSTLFNIVEEGALVLGIGNIADSGFQIIDELK
jgi:poly-gamma-glutamate synthase PgsB/CapB